MEKNNALPSLVLTFRRFHKVRGEVHCPFRGCAGDWVKLGVAKRRGAVLGDTICLNSSLPCVLVDVVRFKMGKFSCCVPGCTNNWRISPEKKFHTLPSDAKVRRSYEKLIRNENLKLNAQHTRICGDHFPDGERMCRTQLPLIFPWTATPKKQRVIEKHEVPSTTKEIRKELEACELRSEDVFAEEIENNVSDNEVPVSEDIDFVVCIDQACQTEDVLQRFRGFES